MAEVQKTIEALGSPIAASEVPCNGGVGDVQWLRITDPLSGAGVSVVPAGTPPTNGIGTMALGATGALQASAAQSANANGTVVLQTLSLRELQLFLNVSAISGAGTLQVFVQTQDPVSNNWVDLGSFGQISYDGTTYELDGAVVTLPISAAISLGTHAKALGLTGANIRLRWEVSGATFTFSVGYVGK